MDLKQLIEKTLQISKRFPTQHHKQDRVLDLVEEVGELCQAILIVEKLKTSNDPLKQRTKTDIADALADAMYDLILLAKDYEVDLDQEYQEMLSRLEKRIDKGEFNR